jgi:hypothetical protein
MINSRAKGNAFEVKFCNRLKAIGFSALTSRNESKRLDDAGVDIVTDAPFFFQLKAVERLEPVHKILAKMPKDKTRAVVHKRNREGVVVSMFYEDFEKLCLSKK